MTLDRIQDLETALDQLKAAAEFAGPKELPAIVREMRNVYRELTDLGVGRRAEVSAVADLSARLAAKRAAAADPSRRAV